jgi:hypothetical protein
MPDISGSLSDLGDALWNPAAGSANSLPAGPIRDLVGGILMLPGNLLFGSSEIFWNFGSRGPA